MSENAEHGQLLELTARIVAAHVGHNEVAPAALPELIRIVHATLAGAGQGRAQHGSAQRDAPLWRARRKR